MSSDIARAVNASPTGALRAALTALTSSSPRRTSARPNASTNSPAEPDQRQQGAALRTALLDKNPLLQECRTFSVGLRRHLSSIGPAPLLLPGACMALGAGRPPTGSIHSSGGSPAWGSWNPFNRPGESTHAARYHRKPGYRSEPCALPPGVGVRLQQYLSRPKRPEPESGHLQQQPIELLGRVVLAIDEHG